MAVRCDQSDFEKHRIKPWPEDGSDRDFFRAVPCCWGWRDQAPRRTVTGQDIVGLHDRIDGLEARIEHRRERNHPEGQSGITVRRRQKGGLCQ